jgi:hypothetical protein
MKIQNGIHLFDSNDVPPKVDATFEGEQTPSRFGYLTVQSGDELIWRLATENDFRKSEATRLQIKPQEVIINFNDPQPCVMDRPNVCSNSFCGSGHGFCTLTFNPNTNHYYCLCR